MSKKSKSKKRGRKNRRLNTRVLTIVSLVVIIFGGIAGGLIYLKIKGSVGRNLALGRAHLEEGQHEKALRATGKVLYRESGNQEAHNLRIKIYESMVPETPQRAQQLYRDYLTSLVQHAQFSPGDEALAMRALDELWIASIISDGTAFWSMLKSEAQKQRQNFQSGSPVYARATLLLGLSEMRLGQANFLGDVDQTGHVRFPGEAALEEYVSLVPDSDAGLSQLAFGRMAVARQLGLQGREQQEERNLELAQAAYDRSLEANPRGPYTLLGVIRHNYIHELVADLRGGSNTAAIRARVDLLMDQLADAEAIFLSGDVKERYLMTEFARYLSLIDDENGDARAAAVLERWVRDHPEDLGAMIQLSVAKNESGDLEGARQIARRVLDQATLPVSLYGFEQQKNRLLAAFTEFDAIDKMRAMEDSDLLRRDAQDLRDEMIELTGGDSKNAFVQQMDGRLAYADGRWGDAVAAYEGALAQGGALSVDALLQASDALERIGQGGLAVQRLEQAVEASPRSVRNRLLLASLHNRLRNYQAALEVLRVFPDEVRAENEAIAQLERQIQLAGLSVEERAITADNLNDPVLAAIARADQAIGEGQLDQATAILESAKASAPEDIRVILALSRHQNNQGNKEEAIALAKQALEMQPDNSVIARQIRLMESDDPIDRLIRELEASYPEGETRDIATFMALDLFVRAREDVSRFGEDADAELDAASRARAMKASLLPTVEAAVERDPQAFMWKFQSLLRASEFEKAEALIPLARERNLDQAQGNVAEARLLLMLADLEDDPALKQDLLQRAILPATRATEVAGWLTSGWDALLRARMGLGDLDAARVAGEQLIARNPDNSMFIRQLAALYLQEGGDPDRAVTILSDAAARLPANRELREAWLQIEAAHGDPSIALSRRQLDWQQAPENRQTALWYAGMIASLNPDYRFVLDARGRPLISGRVWLSMNATEQDRVLQELNSSWVKRLNEIASALAESPNQTLRDAIMHATVLRQAGRRDEMGAVLDEYLSSLDSDDNVTGDAVQISRFLANSDRVWEAQQVLERHRDLQNPEDMEIDAALGNLLHSMGLCDAAMEYLKNTYEITGEFDLGLRLADCLVRMQQLDEAASLAEALDAKDVNPYQISMLKASIRRASGAAAEAIGNMDVANAELEAFRAELSRASEIRPDRPAPYVELIKSLVQEYRRTLDRTLLESALRYCDAASEVDANSPELVIQMADVHESLGDPRRATLELEAFVNRFPADRNVRSRLARSYVAAGMPGRGIDTIQSAITLNPIDPYWHGLLGDHIRETGGDLSEAIEQYITAWKLEPTRRRMTALLDATGESKEWDYAQALEAIRERPAIRQQDPRVVGLQARAESGLRLTARARESLREAYVLYKQAIQDGMMPEDYLRGWYIDLALVYQGVDVAEPLALVTEVAGSQLGPSDLRGLASFYLTRGGDEVTEGVRIMEDLVASESSPSPNNLRLLAIIQLSAGDKESSAKTWGRLAEMRPDDAITLNNYAYLLATELNDPMQAEPIAKKAVLLQPRESSVIDTMAIIQQQLGNYEGALSSLRSRLALEPNDAALLRAIATLLSDHTDRPEEAVVYSDRALLIDPRGAETLDVAGWALWRSGSKVKGRDLIGQSIRRQPTASAHVHMAQIFADARDSASARDHLQQADRLAADEQIKEKIASVRRELDGGS